MGIYFDLVEEMNRGENKFGPFKSPHESIAILREEYLELEQAIFHPTPFSGSVRVESLQVAAVALRIYRDTFSGVDVP